MLDDVCRESLELWDERFDSLGPVSAIAETGECRQHGAGGNERHGCGRRWFEECSGEGESVVLLPMGGKGRHHQTRLWIVAGIRH